MANVHVALVYCPTMEKQIIFAVAMTLWMLPLYTVVVFTSYIFMQFCRTLHENFRQLRYDIVERSKQVTWIFFFHTGVRRTFAIRTPKYIHMCCVL